MIMDGKNTFTALDTGDTHAAVISGGAADYGSTYSIDGGVSGFTGSTVANGGPVGAEPYLVVRVTTAFTSANSTATYQAVLQESVDNSTYTDLCASPVYLISDGTLADNAVLFIVRLPQIKKRYIRLAHRLGIQALTAGAIQAFITNNPELLDLFFRGGTQTVSMPTGAMDHASGVAVTGILDS